MASTTEPAAPTTFALRRSTVNTYLVEIITDEGYFTVKNTFDSPFDAARAASWFRLEFRGRPGFVAARVINLSAVNRK
jgi:hypothetical protein